MDFTLYNQKKTNLQNHISETLGLLQSLKLKNAYKRLQEDSVRLADERFNLVVIGEFSRGKSTFVNALLGKTSCLQAKRPQRTLSAKSSTATSRSTRCFIRTDASRKSLRKSLTSSRRRRRISLINLPCCIILSAN